jgi:hypothetical protein
MLPDQPRLDTHHGSLESIVNQRLRRHVLLKDASNQNRFPEFLPAPFALRQVFAHQLLFRGSERAIEQPGQ